MNILFTCAGRRNYLLEYFKDITGVRVVACDADINAPALYEADEWFVLPSLTEPDYISSLLKNSKERDVNAIISLNDMELPLLATNRHIFRQEGIELVVSEEEVIDICFDKYRTFNFSRKLSLLPIPTFLHPAEAIEYKKEHPRCRFIVKPRWGSASIGLAYPETNVELFTDYEKVGQIVRSSILSSAGLSGNNSTVIIQKRIEGQEYGMDVVNNLKGEYQGSLIRRKISMRSGETNKAITVIDERFSRIGMEIGNELRHVGNLDCDLFLEDNNIYLLEMNPRFGGGYPFMHNAGANLPLTIVECLRKKTPPEDALHYREGVASAKVDKIVTLE